MSAIMVVSSDSGLSTANWYINKYFGLSLKDGQPHPDIWLCNNVDIKNNTIKIATVKDLTGFAATKPVYLPYKLAILTHFELATEEAQNAMLKLLEDTSPNVHFILIVSTPQRVLPTIMSRVQVVYDQRGNQPKGIYNEIVSDMLKGNLSNLLTRNYNDVDITALLRALRQLLTDLKPSDSIRQQLYGVLTNAHRYSSIYLPPADVIIYLGVMFKKILGSNFK